jgi:glycosyltransferase involved in cell wall biosynthesis
MHIGIDARELSGPATGVGRYLAELMARWTRTPADDGHTLALFSPIPLEAPAHWSGRGGARVVVHVVAGTGGTRWEQGALAAAARKARLDVFFAPGYTAPLRLGVPVVVAMHDVSFAAHPEWFRWHESLRQRLLARLTARRAARVVTLTRFSRDEIVRHLGVPASHIEIVPPGVTAQAVPEAATSARAARLKSRPTTEPPAGLKSRPTTTTEPPAGRESRPATDSGDASAPTILYVGSIFTRRHVPELLAAFASIARRHPATRLQLIGADRTWPPQRIGQQIAALGLGGRVEWHDWVADDELRACYAGARVFAFLSEYEGFGLTPLEALQAGVPALVADVPVAHEAFGDAAVFVDPRDPVAVAAALESLLGDEAARARVLAAAPAVLARYSWDEAAARTMAVLVQAAARTS